MSYIHTFEYNVNDYFIDILSNSLCSVCRDNSFFITLIIMCFFPVISAA